MATRSQNIFAYLDSDDEDVPKTVNKKTEVAPPGAPVALNKPAAGNKKTPKKTAVVEGEKKERAPREGAPREGGRGAARGGRGGRGGRGASRDFERRSGTGRGKETSKQGGGARNWGNDADKSELVAEAAVQEGAVVEGEEAEAVAVEETAVEVEDEEVQLTLDEYLAKKKESRVGELFAEKEIRQVTNEFTSAVLITKDGKTSDFMEPLFEKVYTKKTSGRKKQVITDLGFSTAAPERRPFREEREGGRGRGGRGEDREGGRGRGGRSDRGRGAGRGGAGRGRGGAIPNVLDPKAFPTLA